MKEIWKNIKGFEDLYQVSNWGRVRSLDRWVKHKNGYKKHIKGGLRKPSLAKNGYLQLYLWKDGKYKFHLVHRLIAEAFLDNPDILNEVNHKDEDKTNNNVDNLEWCDHLYNVNYGTRNERGTEKKSKTVYQYTLDGEFVKEWQSTREIERVLNFLHGNISKCCLGKLKTAYNYIWKYA